jgi:hypothetical protein
MMYHYAHTLIPYQNSHVWDNGGMSAEAGAAWGQTAFFDTLTVSAGAIIALDRSREDGIWHTPAGGFVSGFAAARMLAARGFVYTGKPLRMAWGRDQWAWRRENLWNGPTAYSFMETSARLDLIARFAVKENIRAELTQAFHLYGSEEHGVSPLGYSQHFVLQAEFGGPPKDRKD